MSIPPFVRKNFIPYSIIIFFILLVILHHQFAFFGYYGYDDITYAQLANDISKGMLNLTDEHFAYRWGLIVPVAILYKTIGMDDLSTAAWSIFISCLFLIIIAFSIRKYGNIVLFFGLSLFIYDTEIFLWTDKIMPDLHFSFYVVCSFIILYSYYNTALQLLPAAILFSITVFLAFLTKELIWLILPVYVFFFFADLKQKKPLNFWWLTILISLVLGGIYFYFIYLKTGNVFSRFTVLFKNQYLNQCSYDALPLSETIIRITYLPFLYFIRSGYLVSIILLISTLITLKINPFRSDDRSTNFWFNCYTITLLSIWFMSISVTNYVPMCPETRHFIYLIPLSAIAIAPSLISNFKERQFLLTNLFLFTITVCVAWAIQAPNLYYYLLIVIVFLFSLVLQNKIIQPAILFCFVSSLYFGYEFYKLCNYRVETSYEYQKTMVINYFGQCDSKTIVITNPVQKRVSQFYLQFDSTKARVLSYDETDSFDFRPDHHIFFLSNGHTEFYSGINNKNRPCYASENPPKGFELIEDYRHLRLYRIHKSDALTCKKE